MLLDNKLFLQVDNDEQSFLVAIDAASGEEVWRVNRDERSQYSSPIIWKNRLRNELIVGGMVYRFYDPQTGNLLWQLDMAKGRSSATPLAVDDRLYVGTEFRNRGGADDGGGFWASPWATDQYVFCVDTGGTTHVLRPGDQLNVVATNEIDEQTWSTPSIANDSVYLRTISKLYCIR